MVIFKVFKFDAAHFLPSVSENHKCSKMHGHSFRVEIHVQGDVHPQTGWVMDFADITAASEPVLRKLDHKLLNNIEGLENPTSENLCRWIWRRLEQALPGLRKVVVQESLESGCAYDGRE